MLHITEKAKQRLITLASTHNDPSINYVRLSVQGGGCAGFKYKWSYAKEEEQNDMMFFNALLIDRSFELYLLGTTLDYKEDDFVSEFVISNPNSKASCGCGESFAV